MTHRTVQHLLLVLLVLAVSLVSGCRSGGGTVAENTPEADRPRILLLGVDGMDWDVMIPMIREGRLPEIQRLMREGVYGLLETFQPTLSPSIWTSVATGKTTDQHGITDFGYRLDEDVSRWHLFTNSDRQAKAFWNIMSDHHRRVHLVGWFLTFPVEPINGVMVAQTNTLMTQDEVTDQEVRRTKKKGRLLRGVAGQVYPPDRQDEMMEILQESQAGLSRVVQEVFGEFPHPLGAFEESIWHLSRWSLRADGTYLAIARRLAAEPEPFDLMAVYLGGTDVLGHRFWRYLHPEAYRYPPSPDQLENCGGVLPDYYAYVDRMLGELRQAVSGEPTVIVVSDHGMQPMNQDWDFSRRGKGIKYLSAGHDEAPAGVFLAAGPGVRQGEGKAFSQPRRRSDLLNIGSVLDITPTLLALLDLPVGEDMRGQVLTEVLDPDYLARHPVQTIPTHDTEEWLASRPTAPVDRPDVEERLEQLRGLGYIQ
jgi:hypothetical protein